MHIVQIALNVTTARPHEYRRVCSSNTNLTVERFTVAAAKCVCPTVRKFRPDTVHPAGCLSLSPPAPPSGGFQVTRSVGPSTHYTADRMSNQIPQAVSLCQVVDSDNQWLMSRSNYNQSSSYMTSHQPPSLVRHKCIQTAWFL
jgi:hypothetical protein